MRVIKDLIVGVLSSDWLVQPLHPADAVIPQKLMRIAQLDVAAGIVINILSVSRSTLKSAALDT